MSGRGGREITVDWVLLEALVSVPCSITDAAIVLGVSDTALRKAINNHRPDLVLKIAAAVAAARAEPSTRETFAERTKARYERIADVVVTHRATFPAQKPTREITP